MNLPFFIAKRYFFSKKKKNFINVISGISMVGVAVGTMALIVVLSVFNGLEGLLRDLYDTFDPELKIVAAKGKSFTMTPDLMEAIGSVPSVSIVTEVIEDNALVKYKDSQMVVRIKGVSENFLDQRRLERSLVQGELAFRKDGVRYAILGRGVQYKLSLSLFSNDPYALQVFSPKNVAPGTIDPSKLFTQKNIMPGGIFAIEKQYDESYIFVPLTFAQELFDYQDRRTSLELKLQNVRDIEKTRDNLALLLGAEYTILTNNELHADLYKLLRWEKFFVFFTFSFILAIASFNIFFSLSMLAIDKQPDIAILNAMGANKQLIKRIFLMEGVIIAGIGAGVGLLFGLVVCWLQQSYGLVSMGMSTSIIDAYPVQMKWIDFAYTGFIIFLITFLASYRPAVIAANSLEPKHIR